MRKIFILLLALGPFAHARAQAFTPAEVARWQQQARRVAVTRDTWGVPHINGKTDADAVFGVLYTQCEDDFARVEDNYLTALGRRAEVDGEASLYEDLRARLFMDSTRALAVYGRSPAWMKSLLNAFAAGTNYYLATHPAVHPRRIRRFQPWMPLLFSEGSIGGNVSVVPADRIKAFYGQQKPTSWQRPPAAADGFDGSSVGSNGFAIAPARSASGHALLLINPHTSFYFRSEVQMTSAAGLNAYGAVTWGQFFIYQGFNVKCGWMHTSSQADSMDEYLETVTEKDGKYYYQYDGKTLPVRTGSVVLAYLKDGQLLRRKFTTYYTPHGPVVGQQGTKWVTVKMMDAPLAALEQSYLRTKATGYASFKEVMRLNGNASNNTVFADAQGTIAYWHGNFMPRRPAGPDWSQPVDGSTRATEWQGLHPVEDLVQVRNPASGFIQNCNSTPFTVSGPGSSPDQAKYPAYMAPDAENYRGVNAVRVLSRRKSFTLDTLIAAADDPHLAGFEQLLPAALRDCQLLVDAASDTPLPADVAAALPVLRAWNLNYSATSVAQTVAIYWAERMQRLARPRVPAGQTLDYIAFTRFVVDHVTPEEKVAALGETLAGLTRDFGRWDVAWGEVNRYQRLTGKIDETYDDAQPSLPVAFTSSAWGSLAAFGARPAPNTKKRYGYVGNSFVAVVEFGPRVVARSVVTGGQDSCPDAPHFTDQAPLYTQGKFKDVWFYPEDVAQHVARQYHPGE
ncbi:penicillin acylase family protein [Hymenobacter caeli]|uniref:Acyl-homoserine lactone acylase PvdQ n=1 Tax=Hymenobacter caeli TaxID=2735894 RepID=A0ABX2FVU0_9BACT|nr:penicillin acylase family protein [Hymenobacter caeli]NRT21269.1 acyl-homoserine lactone acylase PvdQ [Hymenobacter caeli]